MKYVFVISFSLLFVSYVEAQECAIKFSGKVEDFHNNEPLEAATVYIKTLNKYVLTNKKGEFYFEDVCEGHIEVIVSHWGCETQTLDFDIQTDTYKIIDLEHHEEELDEVIIKGMSNSKTKAVQSKTLSTSTLDRYSNLNLGDVLKEISGVSSLNTGSNIVKPVINGLHSSRVLVNVNGVRLEDQEWGIEHAPNVDINSAGSVLVIKGANALEFGGDAIGGVVIVKPVKNYKKDTLFGKTHLALQSNGLGFSLSSMLNKSFTSGWFVNGNATIKRFGDGKASEYYLNNSGMSSKAFATTFGKKNFKQGFEVYYSYTNNELAILRASHIGSVADLVQAINTKSPIFISDFSFDINNPKQLVIHQILKGTFYRRFKGLGRLNIQYDYQNNHRNEYDRRRSTADNNKPAVDLLLQTHSFNSSFKFDAKSSRIFKVGASLSYQNNFADPRTGVRRLIPDYNRYDAGIYAITNIMFNKFIVRAGIRYDYNFYDAQKYYYKSRWNGLGYNTDFSHFVVAEVGNQYLTNPKFIFSNISASGGISYSFNKQNSILLNYALSNRSPNPSELFSDGLHHSAARIELGSLRIKPETSNRIGLSYHYQNSMLLVDLEGFINSLYRFIYIEPSGTEYTIRGAFPVYTYKQTNALMCGINANLRYKITKNWQFEHKSSYIYGNDNTNNRPLIDIPPFKTTNSFQYTNDKWNELQLKLTSIFVGKQNRFPNNNFEAYISNSDSYVPVDVSSTPGAYHLLNFSANILFSVSKINLELGFLVHNILNISYRDYLDRLRYFSDDLGRNFTIHIKIIY